MHPQPSEAPGFAHRPDRKGGKVLAVVLSTVGWFVCSLGLVVWHFFASFCLDYETCQEVDDGGRRTQIVFIVILATLAALVLLPFLLGMPKTGLVYAVVAVAFVVCLSRLDFAREIAGDVLHDDPPTYELDPNQCIPRSGGDSECPGG
ncbi:hypothetical protein [Glycomyces dulcitolivorans]|uniref:hypothetical protein n=1 Tax=Glycomyces dulcitolivorans TaxID=2200759 RepID=UPI000DD3E5BA|nr:hypothetical protein [Glycomyces dulcitolivorans]